MIEFIYSLLEPRNLITILVALSAFATVVTLTAPLLQGDKMQTRMKTLAVERDKLRTQNRQNLQDKDSRRLRDNAPKGVAAQIVDALNLKSLLQAESSRQRLRQAGLRSEKHLVTFLASRVIAPMIAGVVVFVYSATVFADQVTGSMRVTTALIGAVAGFYLPNLFLTNIIKRRQQSIQRAWSDALDLLLICVESGMSVEAALARVSQEIGSQSVPLAEELTLTIAELSFIGDRSKAFENLAQRTGMATVKSVVTSLVQSERYGTPVGVALRVLAQENRDDRMAMAEKKAAALPPKLTVPMVGFFLPVIFIVLLGPAGILAFGT
ncbi:MAG: type II secretion system F family protein [Pseudomonadota bacterium]